MTIRELLAEESPTLRRRLASLFSGLPDETPASPLSCAAGEVVVRQDAPCRCVYVLVDGRAELRLTVEVCNATQLYDVIEAIRGQSGILEVVRDTEEA